MARAKAAPRKRTRAKGGSHWFSGMACGALLAFATGVAVLLGVLLAPCAAAAVLESTPGRPVTRAMLLCGAAFVLAPVWHLVLAGDTMPATLDLLADPLVLGPAWLAGLTGWALCELLPVALRITSDLRATARISALAAEEAALRAEWDLDAS
jgi:hypothetical protein